MDSSKSHVLIVFTICLSFFFHSPSPTAATVTAAVNITTTPSTLLRKTCKHTQYYPFCVKALGSDARTKTAPNLLALTKIALQIGISNATKTHGYIHHTINRKGTHHGKREILEQCLIWYDGVIGSFKSALAEVKDKDFMTSNYDCSMAGDDARYCEEIMTSGRVRELTISTGNKYVEKFSSITVTLTDLLDRASPPSPRKLIH